MNNRSDRPGYGYQLKKRATSLTESWAALTNVSNNHMMLGHLMEWFYTGLGGIYQDDNSVAYEKIIIAPKPVGGIRWVKCSFNSPKGIISSKWKIEGDTFNLKVEVPENTVANIILPNTTLSQVVENGKPISGNFENAKEKDGNVVVEVGFGNYEFDAIQVK